MQGDKFKDLNKAEQDYRVVLFSTVLCNQLTLIYADYFLKNPTTSANFKKHVFQIAKKAKAMKEYVGQTLLDKDEQEELAAQFGEQLEQGIRDLLMNEG